MTFDIIIPHYGASDRITQLCRACLHSIARYSSDYRLIFVDNGSPQLAEILPAVVEHPHLLIRNPSNLGFVKATNLGLQASNAPYVVLLNNDTEAVEGWLEKLKSPLDTEPTVGLVGPRSNSPIGWQGREPARAGWRLLPDRGMLAFFCVMIRRELLTSVGLLDESYGVGLGDDDDYCRRATKTGWKMALVQDLVIPHHHRTTFRTLYTPRQLKSMQSEALAHFRREGQPEGFRVT